MGEATVSAQGKGFALAFKEGDFKGLGLDESKAYELVKAKQGIWLLLEKEKPGQDPRDERILSMVREKPLKERVEGKFEESLKKEELERFKEMLKEGSVVAFKLSPKYKKAVYKIKDEVEARPPKNGGKKESESGDAKEKQSDEYCLEKDGFLVCKSSNRAKNISDQYKKQIEEGSIRGIKSFEGSFYIADDALYQKYRAPVLDAIKGKRGISAQEVSQKLGISKLLAKIVCEFLKDEGDIIEKRKEQFQAIEE